MIMIQKCCNSLQVTLQTEPGFYIYVGIHVIGLYNFISQIVPSVWRRVNKTDKNSRTFIALFVFDVLADWDNFTPQINTP